MDSDSEYYLYLFMFMDSAALSFAQRYPSGVFYVAYEYLTERLSHAARG